MGSSSSSPVLSSCRPTVSSLNSIDSKDSFNFRKNAGLTPKKTSKLKNSLDTLRSKVNCYSQTAYKENTFTNILPLNTQENAVSLNNESNELIPISEEKKTQYSSINPYTKSNSSSSIAIDEIRDSDEDMFENSAEPPREQSTYTPSEQVTQTLDVHHSKLLANNSCPYSRSKFNFAPQSSSNQTNYLEKELFNISSKEIKEKIDQILTLLKYDSN